MKSLVRRITEETVMRKTTVMRIHRTTVMRNGPGRAATAGPARHASLMQDAATCRNFWQNELDDLKKIKRIFLY